MNNQLNKAKATEGGQKHKLSHTNTVDV